MSIRATQTCVIAVAGIPTAVVEGEAFDDDAEIVREYPWLFEEPAVEEATAAPGQRRATRRKP